MQNVDLRKIIEANDDEELPSTINVAEPYVQDDGAMGERVATYVRKNAAALLCRVVRDGRELLIDEVDLTDPERNALRCDDLLEAFRVLKLQEEIDSLKGELASRVSRLGGVDADQQRFISSMLTRVAAAMNGGGKFVTDADCMQVENLYVSTLPYAKLTPQQEADLREWLSADAHGDFERGRFASLNAALEHYGLHEEVDNG